jgi:hypothetical protein
LFRKDHELHHGKRFRFCVYAPKTSVSYEKWIEELEETYACSDGITVDLTPPIPGRVWHDDFLPLKKVMTFAR